MDSSAPLAAITRTDQSGLILIVGALGLAFALVSLLIRVYVRFHFSPNPLGWDDGFVVGAFAFSIFQSACVFLGVHKGLGKTMHQVDASSLIEIQQAGYADDILYIISVWLTKISVALLFLRLSPKRGHTLASKVDVLASAVTAVVSVLIVALRCNLSHPWITINSHNATCAGLFTRWEVVAVFDIALEVLIFATAIYLLQSLRIPFLKKSGILFAFASRLPLVVPIILRLHYLAPALESSNYTLDVTYAILCKQIEISYAIIAATLPCLRPFMAATVTHYGGAAEGHRTKHDSSTLNDRSSSSARQQQKKNENIRLNNLTSRSGGSQNDPSDRPRFPYSQIHCGNSQGSHTVSIEAGSGAWARDVQRAESSVSKQVMIRTEVEHTMEYRSSTVISGEDKEIGTAI